MFYPTCNMKKKTLINDYKLQNIFAQNHPIKPKSNLFDLASLLYYQETYTTDFNYRQK